MAGGASNYLKSKLVDHSLGTAQYTMPVTVYLAAYVGDPGGAGTEVSTVDTGYVRKAIAFNGAVDGVALSDGEVSFPVATANWGTISHLAIFDANSSGNMLWYGPMTSAKTIETDDQLKVKDEDFSITLS